MTHVHFTWEGAPRGKPVPRFQGSRAWYPSWYSAYKESIAVPAAFASDTAFEAGPVSVAISFGIPMPKSWSKRKRAAHDATPHTSKPDVDNLVKGVLDAVTGIIFTDDAQVYSLTAVKWWTSSPGFVCATFEGGG